jgi:hypothetical protein
MRLLLKADNPRWGMEALRRMDVVCVNGMWQSSAHVGGPPARSRDAWAPGSLVLALANEAMASSREITSSKLSRQSIIEIVFVVFYDLFTRQERFEFVMLSKTIANYYPNELNGRATMVLLQKLAFARVVSGVMDMVGISISTKYCIAGKSLELVSKIQVLSFVGSPEPRILAYPRIAAYALLLLSIPHVLDLDADRALKGVVYGFVRASGGRGESILNDITNWLVTHVWSSPAMGLVTPPADR